MSRFIGIVCLLFASTGLSLGAQAAPDSVPPSEATPVAEPAADASATETDAATPPVVVEAPKGPQSDAKTTGFVLGVYAGPVFHLAIEGPIPLTDPGVAISLGLEYRFPGAVSFLIMGDIDLFDAPFPGGNSLAWVDARLGAGVAFAILPWLDAVAFAKAGTYVGIRGSAVFGTPEATAFGMLSASVGARLDFDVNARLEASLAVQGDYCMYIGFLLRASLGCAFRI